MKSKIFVSAIIVALLGVLVGCFNDGKSKNEDGNAPGSSTAEDGNAPGSSTAQEGPVANSLSVITGRNTPISISLNGKSDKTISFQLSSLPKHGSLSGMFPTVTYSPSTNYVGADDFLFITSDGVSKSSPAEVSISIREPILGRVSGGILELNMGPTASLRLYDNTEDNSETFSLQRGTIEDEIAVSAFGATQVFEGVTKIVGDGGNGNNEILLAPDIVVPSYLIAGKGNSHLRGGGGKNILMVSKGDSDIAGETFLEGGPGDNVIFGGGHNKSVLRAGPGKNDLRGGWGADRVEIGFSGALREFYYEKIQYLPAFFFPGTFLYFFTDVTSTHNRLAGGVDQDTLVILGSGDSENIHFLSSIVDGDIRTLIFQRRDLNSVVLNTLKVYRRYTYPFDDIEFLRIKRNGNNVTVSSDTSYSYQVE